MDLRKLSRSVNDPTSELLRATEESLFDSGFERPHGHDFRNLFWHKVANRPISHVSDEAVAYYFLTTKKVDERIAESQARIDSLELVIAAQRAELLDNRNALTIKGREYIFGKMKHSELYLLSREIKNSKTFLIVGILGFSATIIQIFSFFFGITKLSEFWR